MPAKPFRGHTYRVVKQPSDQGRGYVWKIKGPHAPGWPFFDLGVANRKARRLEHQSKQTRLEI